MALIMLNWYVVMMLFPNTNPYSGKMDKVKNLRNWMIDTATVLFDDHNNDLTGIAKDCEITITRTLEFCLEYHMCFLFTTIYI